MLLTTREIKVINVSKTKEVKIEQTLILRHEFFSMFSETPVQKFCTIKGADTKDIECSILRFETS